MHISASLLAADFACLGRELRRAEFAGADSFHFDLMDGHYVPNIALSPAHLSALRPETRLPFHAHLELSNPDEVLERFEPLSADLVVVCRDTLSDPLRTFALIRSQSAQVGLSLSPDDKLANSGAFLPEIDLLLILAVYPGFGGQATQPNTVSRIAEARQLIDQMGLHIPVAVDGGVTLENAPALLAAGADMLVIGTALFRSRSMRAFVGDLREAAPASHSR